MPDIIITPSTGKLEFIDNSAQTTRRHSFTLDHSDGLVLDAPLSAAAISAPLNVINVTVNNSNANYPFVLAQSGETGAKNLLMDGAGGTYNPFTNTATIDISGNSATTTLASNSTNLGGVAAASYVTLTGTQTLTNKTITGTFTGNLTGTGSWATNAVTAINSTQLNGQAATYYQTALNGTGFIKASGTSISYDNSTYTPTSRTITAGSGISGGGDLSANRTIAVDGTVSRRSTATINNVTSSAWTTVCNVDGDNLSSAIRVSFNGTSNSVVVNVLADILVNHFQDIVVYAISGFYSKLTIRIITNNNTGYTIQVKHDGSTSTNLTVEIFTFNSETITFNPATLYSTTTFDHVCEYGISTSGNGGNNSDIRTAGIFYGVGTGLTGTAANLTAGTATNATQLNGQAASYYTNIPARLGYTPVNQAGDTISGNLTVNGNFAVNGSVTAFSASNIYITSSNLTVTDNILLMNALSPYQRYAGIQMYDSGSGTLSQFLWDGEGDYFFLTGSSVNGKIITGPDGQTNLTSGYIPKATAGYKLGNSLIYDNGTNVAIGTTSPAAKLDVVSSPTAIGTIIRVRDTVTLGTGSFAGIHFTSSPGTDYTIGKLTTAAGAGLLQIRDQSGNQFVTVDSGGNVGIGISNPSTKLDVVGAVTMPVIRQSTTLYAGTDITDDNSTRTVYFNIPEGGNSPTRYFKVARIKITGNYQNVSLNGYFTAVSSGNHVGFERKVEFDFIAYAATNPGAPTVTYLKRGPDTTNVLVYAVPNGGGAGTTYYDVYIRSAWYNDTNGELAIRAGYSSAVTVWQSGLDSGTSAPVDTLVNPNSNYSFDTSGNVGIGTTSPFSKLHIYSATSVDTLLESGTSGTSGKLIFKTSDNADLSKYIMQDSYYVLFNGHSNEGFKFRDSSNTVLMTVYGTTNSSYANRVGIGTTAPATTLHVVGVISGSSFSGAGTGLTGTAAGLSIGGNAATATTAANVNNGTLTISTGTGIGIGATTTFTANQSGNSTITLSNTGVTSNVAGTGISVSGATGAVTITNSGVTSAVAGTGVGVSAATGAVTFSIGQAVGTGNTPTFAGATLNGQLNVNHSVSTAIVRLWNAGSTVWSLGVGDTAGSYFNISADFGSILINKTNGNIWISGSGINNTVLHSGTTSAPNLSIGGNAATATTATNANAISFTEVELNAPVTVSGTWTSGNGSEWGEPKFGTSFNQFRYADGNGPYVEYNIPANHHSCFISQLQWDTGGYADCHGVQADGDLVFLRRINTRQLVENSNHGNTIQHDGATVTFAGSGLQAFTKIRITNRLGRIHMTGIAFTRQIDDGYEGTGMVHPAQISHQGAGSGLDADLLDGYSSATANTANTIVLRDASGNFSAGTITATLSGTATTATTANALNTSNSYTGVNFTATGFFQTNLGQIKSDTSFALLTTSNGAQSVSVRGILLGTSYDTTPGANEIRTTNNTSLFLNARGTGDIQFQTADSLKMMLLNNGNVGIGTSSPTAKVESYFSSNAITFNYLATNLNVNSPIPVYGFDVTSGAESRSIKAGIGYERHLPNGRGTLHFYNDSTNDTQSLAGNRTTAGDIKMSLDNSGNLGIGTTQPSWLLTVYAASAPQFTLQNGTRSFVLTNNAGDNLLSFNYGGVNRLQFDTTNQWFNTGNVGIGSTSPTALLNVRASVPTGIGATPSGTNVLIDSNTSNYITFRNTSDNGTYAGLIFLDNNVGGYIVFGNAGASAASDSMMYGAYQDHIFQNGYVNETLYNRTETMRIKQNGNVGIGSNNPQSKLDVNGVLAFGGVAVLNTVNNANDIYANIRVIRNTSSTSADGMYINYDSLGTTSAHIRFYANAGNERMRIQANDGNVGIGTTSAGRKLDVEGIVRTRGASGTGGFEIGAASTGAARWRIEWDSASDSLDFNWVA